MGAVLIKLSSVLMQIVLLVGQLSTSVACAGECYQPKVPETMRKKWSVLYSKNYRANFKHIKKLKVGGLNDEY